MAQAFVRKLQLAGGINLLFIFESEAPRFYLGVNSNGNSLAWYNTHTILHLYSTYTSLILHLYFTYTSLPNYIMNFQVQLRNNSNMGGRDRLWSSLHVSEQSSASPHRPIGHSWHRYRIAGKRNFNSSFSGNCALILTEVNPSLSEHYTAMYGLFLGIQFGQSNSG